MDPRVSYRNKCVKDGASAPTVCDLVLLPCDVTSALLKWRWCVFIALSLSFPTAAHILCHTLGLSSATVHYCHPVTTCLMYLQWVPNGVVLVK